MLAGESHLMLSLNKLYKLEHLATRYHNNLLILLSYYLIYIHYTRL